MIMATGLKITAGHRSFSKHAHKMTGHTSRLPVKNMRVVLLVVAQTFEKWQAQYNATHQSLSWLHCDKGQRDNTLVSVLWCELCRKYVARVRGQKNFTNAWIEGTSNQRTSSVMDHANSSQNQASMMYLKADLAKANKEPVTSFLPGYQLCSE